MGVENKTGLFKEKKSHNEMAELLSTFILLFLTKWRHLFYS